MKEKITIYHNPRCSKSRAALNHFNDRNIKVDIVEYLKDNPSKEEITDILKKLNMKAEDLIRKGENDFKENFKGKKLTEAQWVDAMVKFPKLIQRPIVILDDKAVVARPLEKINELYT